ncbi:hypothetical protein VULLAG_LOCUS20786 [Vulpes lagopus]
MKGIWMAQSVKQPTLGFSSGHYLTVVKSSPTMGSGSTRSLLQIHQQIGNLEETDKYLETYNLPRLNQEEREIPNLFFDPSITLNQRHYRREGGRGGGGMHGWLSRLSIQLLISAQVLISAL